MECIRGGNILTLFRGSRKKISTSMRLGLIEALTDLRRFLLIVAGRIRNVPYFNGAQTSQIFPIGAGQAIDNTWLLVSDAFRKGLDETCGTLFFHSQER